MNSLQRAPKREDADLGPEIVETGSPVRADTR